MSLIINNKTDVIPGMSSFCILEGDDLYCGKTLLRLLLAFFLAEILFYVSDSPYSGRLIFK